MGGTWPEKPGEGVKLMVPSLDTLTVPAVVPGDEPGTVTGAAPTGTTVVVPGRMKPVTSTVLLPPGDDDAPLVNTLSWTELPCEPELVKLLPLFSGGLTVRLSDTSRDTPSERATSTVMGGTLPEKPAEGAKV